MLWRPGKIGSVLASGILLRSDLAADRLWVGVPWRYAVGERRNSVGRILEHQRICNTILDARRIVGNTGLCELCPVGLQVESSDLPEYRCAAQRELFAIVDLGCLKRDDRLSYSALDVRIGRDRRGSVEGIEDRSG